MFGFCKFFGKQLFYFKFLSFNFINCILQSSKGYKISLANIKYDIFFYKN